MAYINEFPHTRNYDQDLGQLICMYKKLTGDYDTLVQIYEIVKKDINDITIEQLQKWLDDGTLANMIANMLNLYRFYDTTQNLLADSSIQAGQFYSTSGYSSINDGYGALWYVSDSQSDNMVQLKAGNLYLNLILNGKFNSKQIGDTITDLDYLFPRIIKSNMDITINNLSLSVTYDTTEYSKLEKINIDFTGSSITAKTPYSMTTAQLLGFNTCNNITIIGGYWDARSSENTAINVNRAQCHGLDIRNSDNIKILYANIVNCNGDGIQYGSTVDTASNYSPKSIEIGFCRISNCNRNGISILDCNNAYIHDCDISLIIDDVNNPVSQPLASIDCEPFFAEQIFKNVRIENITSASVGGIILYGGSGSNSGTNNYSLINCKENSLTVNRYNPTDTTELNVKIEKLTLASVMNIKYPCNIDFDIFYNNYNGNYGKLTVFSGDNYNIKGKAIFGKISSGNITQPQIFVDALTNSTCLIETNTAIFKNNNNGVYIITSAISTSIATTFGNRRSYTHKYAYKETATASSIQPSDPTGLYQPLIIYCNNTFQLSDATGGQLTCNISLPATINKGDIIYLSYPNTTTVLCHILK